MKRLSTYPPLLFAILLSFSMINPEKNETPCAMGTIPFITTWKTDNPGDTNNNQIRIPTAIAETYNYTVDWGDGTTPTVENGNATHTYVTPGTYTVSITGLFPRIVFGTNDDAEKLTSIDQWGDNPWTSMSAAFSGCRNMVGNFSDAPDLSNVTSTWRMFFLCTSFNSDLNNWDVSNVSNMAATFVGTASFNGAIGNWNTSNVSSMADMFSNASAFNQDIGNWNTSNVTGLARMFNGASAFNQDINFKPGAGIPTGDAWDTSSVIDISGMFWNAPAFNQNIGDWNTGSVSNMSNTFFGASAFNQDIGRWDTSSANTMSAMFQDASAFNQDIGDWITSNVNNMDFVFNRASTFNQDLGSWDTSSVTRMSAMFYNASIFNQDIGGWDVSNVTGLGSTFENAINFDQDLSTWNVEQVTSANRMFSGVTLSTANYDALFIGWNAQNLQPNVDFHGGNSQYCAGETARTNMMATDSWTITDGGLGCPNPSFITTWQTDNPGVSNNNQITIPTIGGGYNYDVDWGDGNTTTGETGNTTHTYATPGTYTVTITGTFPRIYFNNALDARKILTIEQWGNNPWTSIAHAFYGCHNLDITNPAIDTPNLANVTDANDMFSAAISFDGDITAWDVSTITDMSGMFFGANAFNQDIGGWDVANVTNMATMFSSASVFNQNIGGWNVSNVTLMNAMFSNATAFNQNIGTWNTGSVTDMNTMFSNADAFNQDLNAWNVGNVTRMDRMFEDADVFNGNISNWNVSNVTNFHRTFRRASLFDQDISGWSLTSAADLSLMFQTASIFNQNIGNWNVSSVVDMNGMFSVTDLFNQDIGNWNVSNVTNMADMFEGAQVFNQDISSWNVSSVTNMSQMFRVLQAHTSFFNQDIGGWNVSNVTDMNGMFCYANSFNQDVSGWNVSNVTNMSGMFFEATSFNQDIGGWNVGNVTDMGRALVSGTIIYIGGMFENAVAFDQNLENWDVRNLASADHMFDGATLSTPNYDALLIGWDTQNLQPNVEFHGGNSIYCAGEAARTNIISSDSWTITDSGIQCTANPFITTWKTDNPGTSANNQITIPTDPFGTYNYSVDWGDGNISTGVTGDITHTYAIPGIYTVSITDTFPRIYFGAHISDPSGRPWPDREKILTIEQWGDNQWESMQSAFWGCINLQGNFSDSPNLSNVQSTAGMFASNHRFNHPVGNWDVSNVEDMNYMFYENTIFNQDITTWDVSKVEDFSSMFVRAFNFNQNIGVWDIGSAEKTNHMFYEATIFNQDISSWDTQNVTDMTAMFLEAVSFNQNIGSWNVGQVTTMSSMFLRATSFNQNIGGWNTSNVREMAHMFGGTTSFNQDIGNWNTGSVFTMRSMFSGAIFNQDISGWDTGNVLYMDFMFYDALNFDQNIGSWNVTNVTNATHMFTGLTLSTVNYDALLIGWDAQNLNSNVSFSGGNSQYCAGEAARANMISSDGWTISDGGMLSPTADAPSDVTSCESYTLPDLSDDNYYYTDTGAGGNQLNAGNVITSSQMIYVYTGTTDCSDENSFLVTIESTVTVDTIDDVSQCESYLLPTLTYGNYFTEPAGQGTELFAGDSIAASQTVYIYFELGTCSDENSFVVTIDPSECEEEPTDTCELKFPKFFTPNNDGNNDRFQVMENPCSEEGNIQIYDRYGALLFQTDTSGNGWDGNLNGNPLPETDYWYQFVNAENGQVSTGHFSLKR